MTMDPVSAVLEGVLLGTDDFDGVHPWKATTEDIIQACMRLVADYGIQLEARACASSDSSFQLGGRDTFSYSNDEDDDGNPAVLIRLVWQPEE